jgi:hypothetical protein
MVILQHWSIPTPSSHHPTPGCIHKDTHLLEDAAVVLRAKGWHTSPTAVDGQEAQVPVLPSMCPYDIGRVDTQEAQSVSNCAWHSPHAGWLSWFFTRATARWCDLGLGE